LRVRFYEFASTRYPPPLLQRRSSDFGINRFQNAKADTSHAYRTPADRRRGVPRRLPEVESL